MAGKGHRYFGQVTWPTFPLGEVNLLETVILPISVSLLLSGKEAKTTDAWGFPPAPQTLTSLSPKRKHKPKCLDQNKHTARAEGILMSPWRHTKHWHMPRKKQKNIQLLKETVCRGAERNHTINFACMFRTSRVEGHLWSHINMLAVMTQGYQNVFKQCKLQYTKGASV